MKALILFALFPICAYAQAQPLDLATGRAEVVASRDADEAVICGLRSQQWGDIVGQSISIDFITSDRTSPGWQYMASHRSDMQISHFPTAAECDALQSNPMLPILDQIAAQSGD